MCFKLFNHLVAKRADWMDGVCVCVCVSVCLCVHIYNLNTLFPINTISVPLYKWAWEMYHFSISGFRHWIIDIELLKLGRLKLSFFVSNWNEEIFIKFEMSIILEMIFHLAFTFFYINNASLSRFLLKFFFT